MDRTSFLYVIAVVAAAVAFSWWGLPIAELARLSRPEWRALAALATLAMIAQLVAMDFMGGKQAKSSLAFIPLLAGAILLPPSASLLTTVPVITVSELVLRRAPLKAAFNIAQVTLAVGGAAWMYTWWAGGSPPEYSLSLIGAVLTVGVFFSTNVVLTSIGLALWQRQPVVPTFRTIVGPKGMNLFYDMMSSPFVVLTAAVYLSNDIYGMFMLIVPLLFLRHTYASRQKLEHANHDLLYALVKAIETRDPYTSGHSRRVATLAELVAEDVGMAPKRVDRVRVAALLHDIGKIDAELSAVLLKPYELTDEERQLIESHAARGAAFLRDLGSLDSGIVAAVRHHHERYDGTGYPDNLAGNEIPLEARIIMMSDSIDAMLSDRPYRRALPVSVVKSELLRCRGTQFDPDLVDVVLRHSTLEKAVDLVDEWRQRTLTDEPPRLSVAR